MRTIICRGKRKDSNEWVYGFLCTAIYCQTIIQEVREINPEYRIITTHMVNPETVGQYTGLKDKAGKQIYEGDVIDAPGHCGIEKVIYGHPYNAAFCVGNMLLGVIDSTDIEIIGNFQETPELLK